MERYCSTGQSPQRAVAPTEEEEEYIYIYIYIYVIVHNFIFYWIISGYNLATCFDLITRPSSG